MLLGEKNDLSQFGTYEDYMDSQVTDKDIMYLGDQDMARQLVELGYRGTSGVLKQEEYEARVHDLNQQKSRTHVRRKRTLASFQVDLKGSIVLTELAKREEQVRNGKLRTIIFIRALHKGKEISGYIDYGLRLSRNFRQYFSQELPFLPRSSDLSYYNWDTGKVSYNSSHNFQVIADSKGLMFKNKRDRKIINIDPESYPGDNTTRVILDLTESKSQYDKKYIQVVLYDHLTRRKG